MVNQVEKNKAICKVFFDELLNNSNIEAIDQFVASSLTILNPFPGQRTGTDGYKDISEIYKLAFPDLKVSFNDIIGDGDKVVLCFTVEGTHKETFLNVPATGVKVKFEEIFIVKLNDEKIVEHWSLADSLSLLRQMGAVSL